MIARPAILELAACLGLCDIAAAEPPESLNPMHALDRAAFGNFVELPLFDPARRLPPPPPPAPQVVAAPAPPPPPAPAPVLQLVGIIRGKRDLAIVHQNGGDKAVILRNGESFDGWTVIVHPLGLTLKSGDRNVDYAMFVPTPGGAPAPVPTSEGQPIPRQPDQ